MKKFVMLVVCALMCVSLVGQEKPAETMKGQDTSAQAMGAQKPKPAPEMEKMKMFLGTWRTTEKHEPSPWMPKGATGKGTATYKLGPGGMALIEDYRSTSSMGGKFMGHGVIWWDEKETGYKSVWCDNMSPGGCEAARAALAAGKATRSSLISRPR
jgi:hypothetical protein